MTKLEDRKLAPPEHLSERSKSLWRSIVPRRARSIERLVILQTALESLDRADAARNRVDAEGLTTKTLTTGALHAHPLLKVEQEARRQFAKLWETLGLNWWQQLDGAEAGSDLGDPDEFDPFDETE